jgi:prefoldin alpha subunit
MVNNVENVDPREIQMLQQYLGEFSQRLEIMAREMELIEHQRLESIAAGETLQVLNEAPDETVLLQLGGGASLRVKVINPDKVLLNIGSDVIVQRTNAESIAFLQDRVKEMEVIEKKLAASMEQIQKQAQDIAKKVEAAYKQAQMSLAGQ